MIRVSKSKKTLHVNVLCYGNANLIINQLNFNQANVLGEFDLNKKNKVKIE